jgi:uncharacterized protein
MTSESKKIDRRAFLKAAGLGGASMALTAGLTGKAPADEKSKAEFSAQQSMPTRILGKTGVPVSILSLGGALDLTSNQILLRMALKMGITHWDTASNYANGNSEIGIGTYFEKYPEDRKKIFLVTKASGTYDPDGMTERLYTSMNRLNTDYIDCYFMHNVTDAERLTPDVQAWAEKKKKEGKIRFFGFSTHGNMERMLMHAATLGWIDAVMATYNYHVMLNDDMNAGVDACAKAGIGLVAMKTQGSPLKLIDSAKELSVTESFIQKGFTVEQAKLKTVWQDERITACCSKMKNMAMLKDNVAAALDSRKLTEKDIGELHLLSKSLCGFYCRGCGTCNQVMGMDTRIPDVLRYMMYYNSYGETEEARRLYREITGNTRRILLSTDFTPAERKCPQKIEIRRLINEAEELLG